MEPPTEIKVPENAVEVEKGGEDVQRYKNLVNLMKKQADMLEDKVLQVERFYSSNRKKLSLNPKNKEKGRNIICIKKQQGNAAPSESMQELICQFGKILNQIIQRQGVLDDDLALHNCPELTGKPRDFSAIRRRLEIKDGSGYNHVREVYYDVRSVLKNAMKYNDERSDAHVTANTLLDKFEEKWLQLLPKVMNEDKKIEGEQDAKFASHAQMAKEISGELIVLEEQLIGLKDLVIQKCRNMSTLEKRNLGATLAQLSPDDLTRALEIVAESNPDFQVGEEVVDLDIDAQSEYTLRRLKYFVVDVHGKPSPTVGGNNNGAANTDKAHNSSFKRRREILDIGGKPVKKRKIKTQK